MAERYVKDVNGNVVDMQTGKIVVKADGSAVKKKTGKAEPPEEKKVANGYKQAKPLSEKAKAEKENAQKSHTILAKEIIDLNRTNPVILTDPRQIIVRGDWFLGRCIELGISPTIIAFLNALGINKLEERRVLSGEFGNSEVKSVISTYMQAIEQVAEGALVDSVSGQVGRIAQMRNKFDWTDNAGYGALQSKQNLTPSLSSEELKKLLTSIPQTDLTDEKKAIDVEFEVIEGGK